MAQKCKWREKRGNQWSKTEYTGIRLAINCQQVLVSLLSHGLRVWPIKVETDYSITDLGEVDISNDFVDRLESALKADAILQEDVPSFEALMSS